MDIDVDRLPAAHRVFAEDTARVTLFERRLDAHDRLGEFAADIDVAGLGADRVRSDRAPFDEGVRRPPHDLAVLERTWLGLVGVTAEVVRLAVARFHERP